MEALRSGEYEQTKGMLYREDEGYCCLGVLTDLFLKEKGLTWNSPVKKGESNTFIDKEELPEEVQQWAGVEHSLPYALDDERNEDWELAVLNDEGSSFSEIADLIEKLRVQ